MSSLTSSINTVSNEIVRSAGAFGIAYGAAWLGRSVLQTQPWAMGVANTVSYLISKVIHPIFDAIFRNAGSNTASKLLGNGIETVISTLTTCHLSKLAFNVIVNPWELVAVQVATIVVLTLLAGP